MLSKKPEALRDMIYLHCLKNADRWMQLTDWPSLPSIHGSVHLTTVKTSDISPLSVSPWVYSMPLTLRSTMGRQGEKHGELAGHTRPVQGGWALYNPLFSSRLALLNRHRVNQHISLCPSRASVWQFAVRPALSLYVCLCGCPCKSTMGCMYKA